ncbi:MAG: DUF420 domain-containing protein [Bacteroidetes bacterium]|nr:DUF420 domain-containing protein [Bacteroidota bacterium]
MEPNLKLAKKLNTIAWVVTVFVLLLVGMMRRIKIELPEGWDFCFLPPFHAGVNALTFFVLLVAFYFIKQKRIEAHRKTIYIAVGLSVLFLLSYVTYHITTPETLFGDVNGDRIVSPEEIASVGSIRSVYFFFLITHILLAGIILPFILFTFVRAYTNQVEKHRKMAKWVFPLWLYVTLSGPICYLMLMPYY